GVTLVRAWKIAPGMETVNQAAGQLVQRHACRYGGYLQVLRPMFAPTSGPNVVTAISFPDWSAFGPFLDEFNEDPEIQQLLREIRANEHEPLTYDRVRPGELLPPDFDRQAWGAKGYAYERLDQLLFDLLMGVR
ncbi:MAG: hypothetical protein LOD91_06070, partial [Limnochordales bacterium]